MEHIRCHSPFGEYYPVFGENAPDEDTEDRLYALMTRVRAFDWRACSECPHESGCAHVCECELADARAAFDEPDD